MFFKGFNSPNLGNSRRTFLGNAFGEYAVEGGEIFEILDLTLWLTPPLFFGWFWPKGGSISIFWTDSCKNSDKYLKKLIFSATAAGWTHDKPHFRAFQTVFYIFYLKTLFLANYQWYKRFILLAKWQKLAFRRSEFLWIVRMISFVVFLCAAGAENWNTHF